MKARLLFLPALLCLFYACAKESEEALALDAEYCNADTISFSKHVQPILLNNCMPCHNASLHRGDVILDNYNDIAPIANSGTLIGVVRHDPGFIAMPPNGKKITNCSVRALEVWIAQGVLNN